MRIATLHAKVVQVTLRLFALALVAAGVMFIVAGLHAADGVLFDREPDPTAGDSAVYVAVGVASAAVGVWMARRRAHRPDLGDVSWWAGRAGGYDPRAARGTEPRSWWTGEPRAERRDRDV